MLPTNTRCFEVKKMKENDGTVGRFLLYTKHVVCNTEKYCPS